ncbi:Sec-independent protein translocase protein TatB [Aquamicrobium soli]|uniref:Sec-independent protein translocase protein TatB n=1 Tax=Aquamicrobium soli TaxID=1811518 RepID=A0ABV7KJI3_9HYPH
MFEVGWTEMLVIAIVMIVVVGPKDLPNMLRTFGRTVAKLRSMAGDFQKQFNDALKEAELEDVKKSVDALRGLNPAAEIKKQLNPFEQAAADVRSGLDNAMKPKPAADATSAPEEKPAETLKADGAAEASAPAAADDKAPFPAMTDSSVVAASAATPEPAKAAEPKKRAASKPKEPAAARPAPAKAAPVKKAPAEAKAAKAETPASQKAPRAPRKKTAGAAK